MCLVCDRGIDFKPGDLVTAPDRVNSSYDKDNDPFYNIGEASISILKLGVVEEQSEEYGTVKVRWGSDVYSNEDLSDTESEQAMTEWCWPSDFYARIRDGVYKTMEQLMEDE